MPDDKHPNEKHPTLNQAAVNEVVKMMNHPSFTKYLAEHSEQNPPRKSKTSQQLGVGAPLIKDGEVTLELEEILPLPTVRNPNPKVDFALNRQEAQADVERWTDKGFKKVDLNQNGKVDKTELAKGLEALKRVNPEVYEDLKSGNSFIDGSSLLEEIGREKRLTLEDIKLAPIPKIRVVSTGRTPD